MVKQLVAAALTLMTAISQYNADAQVRVSSLSDAVESINGYMASKATVKAAIAIDTLFISDDQKSVEICFKKSISDYPLRDNDLKHFKDLIRSCLPTRLQNCRITLTAGGKSLDRLACGFFSGREYSGKEGHSSSAGTQWITDLSSPAHPDAGLAGRYIALWPGHGYYYSHTEDRWKWQRAPFFSTIEDLLPYSYVTQFLAPMLENAGARVFIPRERDSNPTEIIVDNGDPFYAERDPDAGSIRWTDTPFPGFAFRDSCLESGENPFRNGTARMVECNIRNTASASYLPFFPSSGDYAVYVSYQSLDNSAPALYTVRHSGGDTRFTVDQSIGGGTWVYLGTFRFSKGETGQGVIVRNCAEESNGQGVVTTDAVRFGGGTGNVVRGNGTSGVPRFAEAARYWMQWNGYSREVYSLNGNKDDYRDDFMSRGHWVNSLRKDFSIPVDMALALHTDAGTKAKDSIVGTLAIYKEESEGSIRYTDGTPRITARELSDIVQTNIVNDIRTQYREDWTRRAIWDRSYMEARVPDVPTALIELLSHQNFADMQCALDPEFRFIVSRAIYKGILKYLSYVSGTPYTVQPLPVKDFSAVIQNGNRNGAEVRLRWSPSHDPSETTAEADAYIVYRRVTDLYAAEDEIPGFDNGTLVKDTGFTDRIKPGKVYSYKVVAINSGGLSFPSEILSAGYIADGMEALVVNGFTDVYAPASLPVCDSMTAGFDFKTDHGVPYVYDISYIGEQYEFQRNLEWIHDDRPGFGASFMDYGPSAVAGNTFDYPLIHGLALMRSGMSFSSASVSSFMSWANPGSTLPKYAVIDLIFGKNSDGILTAGLRNVIEPFCAAGGSVIISGSSIGKAAAYQDRTYPESEAIHSAMENVRTAARQLTVLKDSLARIPGSGKSISEINSLITAMSELSGKKGKVIENGINDLFREKDPAFIADSFAADVFRYGWSNGSASSTGKVRTVPNSGGIFADSCMKVSFMTAPNPYIYCVESADAILPSDDRSFTFMRYEGANTSAAVAYDGEYRCVSIGFPIEALTSQQQVDGLMREVVRFLLRY